MKISNFNRDIIIIYAAMASVITSVTFAILKTNDSEAKAQQERFASFKAASNAEKVTVWYAEGRAYLECFGPAPTEIEAIKNRVNLGICSVHYGSPPGSCGKPLHPSC